MPPTCTASQIHRYAYTHCESSGSDVSHQQNHFHASSCVRSGVLMQQAYCPASILHSKHTASMLSCTVSYASTLRINISNTQTHLQHQNSCCGGQQGQCACCKAARSNLMPLANPALSCTPLYTPTHLQHQHGCCGHQQGQCACCVAACAAACLLGLLLLGLCCVVQAWQGGHAA